MTTGDSQSVQTANTVCPIKSQLIHLTCVKPFLPGQTSAKLISEERTLARRRNIRRVSIGSCGT